VGPFYCNVRRPTNITEKKQKKTIDINAMTKQERAAELAPTR